MATLSITSLPSVRDHATDPLALYVHWPFCVSKCPYCDFNSHVRADIDQDAWRAALLSDMAHEAKLTGGRTLSSIFFGGGTPSLMPPATAAALIEAAERHWGFAPDIEITLEANPSSVEAARFADLALAGVNRVSLGLQALEDSALRFLGRAHDVAEGLSALDTAQETFARVSFDLIYALPDQSEAQWQAQLERALGFGTGHLSLYQLTIEPGTRFETMVRRGEFTPADADHAATLYELTQALTEAAGIPAYEVSNHARPGEASRHNLTYWRYGDFAGIGPGAHGRRRGAATERHRKPENWMGAIARNGNGIAAEQELAADTKAVEALVMGLRLAEGVDIATIEALGGRGREAILDIDAVTRLSALGFLDTADGRLKATPSGMLLLEALLREIILL
jgi:putative oxygen-independent coproporphyrinogen III oxidase